MSLFLFDFLAISFYLFTYFLQMIFSEVFLHFAKMLK